MLQRSSSTKMKSSNLRLVFLECFSESIFFTKNHFFTNKKESEGEGEGVRVWVKVGEGECEGEE